ncbi:unnamed protein product [Blepharisma stoltei]|uniref:Hyaluronan/mRNA-binding protein domain-containing protein n=1 Tax=Blepharisma stoltei TaxID=1481888 RepID=A0AAU9K585_9CILI|nr:unnamed protein product [Blepharisma stoltei]
MDREDHKRSVEGKKDKDARLDRHSAQGVDPNPKKGGHGGWGTYNESEAIEVADRGDPNYDPEEEKKQS